MTREELRKNKEREKKLKELIKQIAKKYEMKNKENNLFFVYKDYFVNTSYYVNSKNNTMSYCVNIKYLDYDDIQWDILGMPSNKKEPLSLRATGAFSSFSYHLVAPYKILTFTDNPEEVINSLLKQIKQMVDNYNEDLDEQVINEPEENKCNTLEFIAYIHQKEYKKARQLAEDCLSNGDEGQFEIGGKNFFELAMEYLNKNHL